MKTRLISFILAAAVAVAVAAPSLFSLPDKFRTKYPTPAIEPGGEVPISTVARALYESPATGVGIQIYDDETRDFRNISAVDIPSYAGISTATLTSAAAATPVNILPDSAVPAGKKVYISNYYATVSGGTDWATTTSVTIEDTAGVDFSVLTASALDANEVHGPFSDSATLAAAMKLGTGGTAAKGIQVVGNANGTGSDLVVTVVWVIK